MTPSFIGLIATILPGVRPSMSLASFPTASTRPFSLLMATIDGSFTTMPLPRAYTHVFAVPRSMARSLENREKTERRLTVTPSDDRQQNAVLAAILHAIHGGVGRLDQLFSRTGHVGQ